MEIIETAVIQQDGSLLLPPDVMLKMGVDLREEEAVAGFAVSRRILGLRKK